MEDLRLNLEDAKKRAEWKGEPVWLTPHLSNPQPVGKREKSYK